MTRGDAIEILKSWTLDRDYAREAIALDMAIKALEDEPRLYSTVDAVSRKDVYELIKDINDMVFGQQVSKGVANLPTVKPQPQPGHWIIHEQHRECSECTVWLPKDMPRNSFCPNCGAKMIEPQERSEKECR